MPIPLPAIQRSRFIRVCLDASEGFRSLRSSETVRLGNDRSCDLPFDDPRVEPAHAEIYRVGELWWVRDLDSADGTYLDEEFIDVAPVTGPAALQLGVDGPTVWLDPEV